MKICALGLITATFLGVLFISTSSVNAANLPKQSKETKVGVRFIENPHPDNKNLKLIHVPENYTFQTKLLPEGNYTLNGTVKSPDNTITVFNDKSQQDWSVKARVLDLVLHDQNGNVANVTSFKINNQELVGEKADSIVHKSEKEKTADNNTGYIARSVDDEGLFISFNANSQKINANTVFEGQIKYSLYDTPDAT